jgi:2-C-methyl-D-erythritol 4-phosphate cytidylyltransferase
MDYAIIVAGGKGLRMGGEIPKQFIPVAGKPILMHTLEKFRRFGDSMACLGGLEIILVLPEEQQEYWAELCTKYSFKVPHTVVNGGETRFHSVQNGLKAIPDNAEGLVGIHDGVRPFVSLDVIKRCYEEARVKKAVIPVMPVTDTLRDVTQGKNVYRENYKIVQTPQTFDIQLLKAANQQPYSEAFTDDASVVEAIGQEVTMVEGNRENIKITTPFDLKIADVINS